MESVATKVYPRVVRKRLESRGIVADAGTVPHRQELPAPNELGAEGASGVGASAGARRGKSTATERVFTIASEHLAGARTACRVAAEGAGQRGRVRVWIPSCQGGGLTYLFAMLLADAAAALAAPPRIAIFGTDLDDEALAFARAGRYEARAALGMDPELRGRYTVDEGETIRVSERLRELCVFAHHDIERDPPMVRMDLVVCHRVFDSVSVARQSRVVESLHYSLGQRGLLLAFDHVDLFAEDRFERIQDGYLRARRAAPQRPSGFVTSAEPRLPDEKPPRWTQSHGPDGSVNLEPFIHSIGLPLLLCDSLLHLLFVSVDAKAAFGLSDADVGAPLESLLSTLPGDAQLLRAARRVVDYKLVQELEIRLRRRTYLARISAAAPGIAIVFTDVSAVEAAKANAITQRHQHAAIARISEAALLVSEPSELYDQALAVLFGNISSCSGGLIVELAEDGVSFDVTASRGLGNEPLQTLRALGDRAQLLASVMRPRSGHAEAAQPQPGLVAVDGGVACPIVDDDRVVLAVIVLYARTRSPDLADYRHFVQSVANVLGAALVRLRARRRLTLELEMGRLISSASDVPALGAALGRSLKSALRCEAVELWCLAGASAAQPLFSAPRAGGPDPESSAPPERLDAVTWRQRGAAIEIVVPLPAHNAQQRHWLCLRGMGLIEPDRELREGLLRIGAMLAEFLERSRILELSRKNEASLREADRQKDDFLAMLGHELRNPMAAIRNATDLLGRIEQPTPQLVRLQSIFDRQSQQTSTLIEGLLDVARVARGKVELHITSLGLCALVRQVLDDRRAQFHGRVLDATLPESELWIDADRVRMIQILDNLISNALKFTALGGRISVSLERSGGRGVLEIVDDGLGIEPQLLPRIFEPFRQGRASRGAEGLGLGLALVKGLLELHGFDIRVDSEGIGRGARFRISFPETSAPDSPAPESRVDRRPLDLLLVEDNSDIAETLVELLAAVGHQVRRVSSAEAALDTLSQHPPDVLLCDIGLPGMDGIELAKRLRQDERFHALKLVAMTGFGDASTRDRVVQAGFDRMLIKPVSLDSLSHCLSRVAAAPRASRD